MTRHIKILYVQPDVEERACAAILEETLNEAYPNVVFTVIATSNSFKSLEYAEDISVCLYDN